MGNKAIDWTQAPDDADAWLVDDIGGPIWVTKITLADAWDDAGNPRQGLIPICGAPLFGWVGGVAESYTERACQPLDTPPLQP